MESITSPLNDALERTARAIRQEKRMQESHRFLISETERVGHTSGLLPQDLKELDDAFKDDVYFLVIAVRQVISAVKVLELHDTEFPQVENWRALRAWRNVLEHWDAPHHGKLISYQPQWEKFKGSTIEAWGMTVSGQGADSEVSIIENVSITRLRKDLLAICRRLHSQRQQHFDYAWLTPAQAMAHLGLDQIPTNGPCGGLDAMTFPNDGRRYSRTSLDKWLKCMRQVSKRHTGTLT